jgi:hypothetical protein
MPSIGARMTACRRSSSKLAVSIRRTATSLLEAPSGVEILPTHGDSLFSVSVRARRTTSTLPVSTWELGLLYALLCVTGPGRRFAQVVAGSELPGD